MKLDGEYVVLDPNIPVMDVGQTFRFVSAQAGAKIVFPGSSPFRADKTAGTSIPEGVILTLVSDSEDQLYKVFKGECHMKGKNGKTVKLYPNAAGDGGEFHVRRP
jgi:hypothetical protein